MFIARKYYWPEIVGKKGDKWDNEKAVNITVRLGGGQYLCFGGPETAYTENVGEQ